MYFCSLFSIEFDRIFKDNRQWADIEKMVDEDYSKEEIQQKIDNTFDSIDEALQLEIFPFSYFQKKIFKMIEQKHPDFGNYGRESLATKGIRHWVQYKNNFIYGATKHFEFESCLGPISFTYAEEYLCYYKIAKQIFPAEVIEFERNLKELTKKENLRN